MKRILLIMIILCLSAGAVYAEPTVKEILQKKMDNDQLINTMECKLINEWYSPSTNKIFSSNGYLWMKGKDKNKIEVYDNHGMITETTISNSTGTVTTNPTGTYIVDKREELPATTLSEGELIEEDIDQFLDYYTCTLENIDGDLYTIKIVPKEKSQEYDKISKIEETFDYAKGCEVKGITFDISNTPVITIEYSDLQQINGVWLALQKSVKTTSNGHEIVNIVKYENTKINEAISDDIFIFELP